MSTNLSAQYLGLRIQSPIVIGACPMTLSAETVRICSAAGVGAVVLPSLFEEQIVHQAIERGEPVRAEEARVESRCYDKNEDCYNGGPQGYLDSIRQLKATVDVPIIASLNGCTNGNWLRMAGEIQAAGADALEVFLEPTASAASTAADAVEEQVLSCVSDICDQVSIPVSVKLSPFHSNLTNLAWRLTEAGATGVVCFAHEPTWRIHTDRIEATLSWSLTPASNINTAIAGVIRVRSGNAPLSLAASGGISTAEDIVKAVVAGADVVMITSQLYRTGPDAIAQLAAGLVQYLEHRKFGSFQQLVDSRPSLRTHRSSYLRCLTAPSSTDDPTPGVSTTTGDRWGHTT